MADLRAAAILSLVFMFLVVLPVCSVPMPAQQAPATGGVPPGVHAPAPGSVTDQAIAALSRHQAQAALDLLQPEIEAHPDDAAANLLAASCEIQLDRPAMAVAYGERARNLEPDNWKIRTTLVTAYSMAGKTNERDAERSGLRELHDAGKVKEASQTSGFLLDIFEVKQYQLEAIEYFKPVGKFHIYFRFLVRKAGQRVWQIDVQSDDYNQASWAKAYPQQAAEGQRQFQLTGEGNGIRNDYRSFSGAPNYDWIKARVIEVIQAQVAPFPGEAE